MKVMQAVDPALHRLARSAAYPGLTLLVLFGARARGDAAAGADWDFGYVAADGFRPDQLLVDLTQAVKSEHIDLVDLTRA